MATVILTVRADNVPDEMVQRVIDHTDLIIDVWSRRNDYGATWSVVEVRRVDT